MAGSASPLLPLLQALEVAALFLELLATSRAGENRPPPWHTDRYAARDRTGTRSSPSRVSPLASPPIAVRTATATAVIAATSASAKASRDRPGISWPFSSAAPSVQAMGDELGVDAISS